MHVSFEWFSLNTFGFRKTVLGVLKQGQNVGILLSEESGGHWVKTTRQNTPEMFSKRPWKEGESKMLVNLLSGSWENLMVLSVF